MVSRSLVVGCALVSVFFTVHETSSFAQRSAPNPCIDLVRAAELPTGGLDTVTLPSGLRAVCEQFVRLPVPTRSSGEVDLDALAARAASYRAIVQELVAVPGCDGRCGPLRRTLEAYAIERIVRDLHAGSEAIFEGHDASGFRATMARELLARATDAVSRYDQAIALAHTEALTELEAALRRRRDAVDVLRARFDADAHPMIPGTTCAAETQYVYRPSTATTQTSRTVIVFGSSSVDAPLTEAEHTRVVDAARETIARTFGLEVVSKAGTDAIMREARNGRALGREACAAPLTVAQAVEDARPDAIAATVKLECRAEGCFVRVDVYGTNVVVPANMQHLRSRVAETPERVSAWVAAARTFEASPRDFLGSGIGGGGPPAGVSRARAFGEGLTAEEVETAAVGALPELAACASATPVTFDVVLDVDARGRVRVVRRNDEADEGADCRARVLERIRLAPGSGTRRVLVGAWVNRRARNVTAQAGTNTPSGVRYGMVTSSDRRVSAYEATQTVERVVAACDTARVTRPTPLAASIAIAIDGTGRVTAATMTSDDATVNRCVEAELARQAYACPRDRRSAQLSLALCSFPP